MNFLLYLTLLVLPLPLFHLILKHKHYLYCLPPFMALIGIYLFNLIGSINVINDESLFSYKYYYSLLTIIIFFYAFYIIVFSFGNKLYIDWSTMQAQHSSGIVLFLIALWSYSFYMFFLYYKRHGLPPLFGISLFQYTDIYALRAEKTTSLPEGMYWYRMGLATIPSLIFIYTYVLKVLYGTRKYKFIFYINLPLVLLSVSLTLSKSAYVYLLFHILLVNFLLKGGQFELKKLYGYISLGVISMILMIRIYLWDRGFIDVLELAPRFLFRRICVVYTQAHAYIVQIFPDQHDYFDGLAFFPNPGSILPFEPVSISQFLGYWAHGVLQNYSTPSFSQGYANFGFQGIILVVLLMFFQILLFQIIFKECPKNPLFLALYIFLAEKMMRYAIEPIQSVIPEELIIFYLLIILLYYFLSSSNLILRENKAV
jgi:hypothetical protein